MMSCHMKIEESNEMYILKDYNKIDKRNQGERRDSEIKSCYYKVKKKQKVMRGCVTPIISQTIVFQLFIQTWTNIFCCPTM